MSDETPQVGAGAGFDEVGAILEHSRGLADAAEGNLAAPVERCPGWTVADLVRHVTEVHWFWGTIAGERLAEPPDESRRPPPVPDERLVEEFRAGAERLAAVLRAADGSERVWTWAPAQQDIAFIRRHQVQEAAVHHFDAAHAARADAGAAGVTVAIAPAAAADAVSEFLTFSVSSDADPADPPRPDLDGRFSLVATDAAVTWDIGPGRLPGTVAFTTSSGATPPGEIVATASELLLWLYNRVELDTSAVPPELVARFRALCFTD